MKAWDIKGYMLTPVWGSTNWNWCDNRILQ